MVALRDWTGAAPASSERLDVAKFVFILLVCAGHWCEPFYKIGNKPAQVMMHAIYGFHVPAFVLISGYVSGDLNPKRRRALIGGVVVPFLVLHVLYSVSYTKMFCERDDGRPACEFVKHWSLVDPANGRWDGWDKWTFAYPFAHLWYLVSLVTKRVWRPFALEIVGRSSYTSSEGSSSGTPPSGGSSPSTVPPCTCPISYAGISCASTSVSSRRLCRSPPGRSRRRRRR